MKTYKIENGSTIYVNTLEGVARAMYLPYDWVVTKISRQKSKTVIRNGTTCTVYTEQDVKRIFDGLINEEHEVRQEHVELIINYIKLKKLI